MQTKDLLKDRRSQGFESILSYKQLLRGFCDAAVSPVDFMSKLSPSPASFSVVPYAYFYPVRYESRTMGSCIFQKLTTLSATLEITGLPLHSHRMLKACPLRLMKVAILTRCWYLNTLLQKPGPSCATSRPNPKKNSTNFACSMRLRHVVDDDLDTRSRSTKIHPSHH